MIEKEIKILLTKAQYQQVEKLFYWDKDYLQTNHYYNDPDNLKENQGNTIRVREKAGEFRLQVKAFISKEGNLHIMREYEKKVDKLHEVITSTDLEDLTGMKFSNLHCIGSLATQRKECNTYEGVTICLDKNTYLDIEDYELELEYTGDYPEYLLVKLKENGIYTGAEEDVDGKNIRFTKRWKQSFSPCKE